jgi:hypothetical protein
VSRLLLLIKRKVEFDDVDDGLAQETERAAVYGLIRRGDL